MEFLLGHNSFIPYKMIFTMVFKWKSTHCSDHFDSVDELVEHDFTVVPQVIFYLELHSSSHLLTLRSVTG